MTQETNITITEPTVETNPPIEYNRVVSTENEKFYYDSFNYLVNFNNQLHFLHINKNDNKHTLKAPYDLSDHPGMYNYFDGTDWFVTDINSTYHIKHQQIITDIDIVADSLIYKRIGARQAEYQSAAAQAKAWVDSNYQDDIPPMIKASVNATGVEPQVEASTIIYIAQMWEQASAVIREKRLAAKFVVRGYAEKMTFLKYSQAENAFAIYKADMDQLDRELIG